MSENKAINRQNTMKRVLSDLGSQADTLANMLPPDLPLDRFKANITQALSSTPALLDCEPRSLVQACMKAAYDGLRIDGREAVIVSREMVFNRGKPGERKVLMASYMPMAFGLIQQVLRGGEVKTMFADVIYENDEYHVQRGTAPGIHHVPKLDGPRGDIIAAYSVATWGSGAMTFELLTRADLEDVRDMAQAKNVWERWPGEMSKKSAIRRHRKTLPIGNRDILIRDSEQDDLYPDIRTAGALPAPTERPTRQAIAAQQGTEAGQDLGDDHDEDGVVVEQGPKPAERAKPKPKADQKKGGNQPDSTPVDMPGNEEEWRMWSTSVQDRIVAAADAEAVNAIATGEAARLEAATKERRDFLRGLISDRLADFVTGASDEG